MFESQQDDLIDDLINIVQKDDQENENCHRNFNKSIHQQKNENECFFNDEDYENDSLSEEILIDEMLEKPIDLLEEPNQVNFYTYNKTQIKNLYLRGSYDSMLPEGWVQVTHSSGMPLYLNRQSRVCTLSRPYYIGQSSARKHDIPINSVPCLAYRQRKEAIENQMKEHQQTKQQTNICAKDKNLNKPVHETLKCLDQHVIHENPNEHSSIETENNKVISDLSDSEKINPNNLKPNKKIVVSIQTNEEKLKENILTPEKLNDYCKRLFEFEVIKVKKFKTWSDRKKFIRKSKQKKFPENAKMLKVQTKTQKGINKELNINMTNKTPLSILYEYTSQIFKTNPRFEIQEKENPKDPFQAIVYINDKICGKGNGNSKKTAKNNAAEAALCVLIPDFKSQISDSKKNSEEMYAFFDGYNIEHTHVYLLSQKLGAPFPYDVLLTCLKYNFAINMSRNRHQFIEEEIKPIKYRNCLYRMKLAQYDVEVNCTKKKEGRQLAAQKILKLMHPHILTWGSILRLYGSKIRESLIENETNDINSQLSKNNSLCCSSETDVKSNQQKIKPNKELLEKLKEEMRKLRNSSLINKNLTNLSSENVVIAAITNNLSNQQNLLQDSILTIPPLHLNNSEFKLNSNDFLMNNENLDEKGNTKHNESDGKILLDLDWLKIDKIDHDAKNIEIKNKRKLNIYSDEEDNSYIKDSSESSESNISDIDSEVEEYADDKNTRNC